MQESGNNRLLAVIISVIAVAVIAAGVVIAVTDDRTAPTISITDLELVYRAGDDESVLLTGVTANDKKDGDVTDSIIVEGMVMSEDNDYIKVCYVAKDKSNNIVKAHRIVTYIPAEGENKPSVGDGGQPETDASKKDEGEEESKPSQNGSGTGSQTGSESGSEAATQPTPSGSNPVLTLKYTEVTLKAGSRFNVAAHVADISDDKDDSSTLFRRIIAEGSVSTDVVGDYQIKVYCSDTDGNLSEKKELMVHITE